MHTHYGHLARILHWCTDQSITNALAQMDLTASQGHILGYLSHQKYPPCPKDIEEVFRLTHPTVSGLLSRMEKKGFIKLEIDPNDRRCKRVYILPKGLQCAETMRQTIRNNEERLVQDFTEEERVLFAQFLTRAIDNMGCHPCKISHKEETTK